MNSVPPWASSSAPVLRCCSPLDCSTPNSSTSIRSGVIAAALMTTNGPSARPEAVCSVRAASSLPAPDGPTIRMRLLALAARSMVWRSWFMQGERPVRMLAAGASLLQFPHLALEPRGFQRAGRDQDQPVGLERLFDEVIGAALDRRDRGFDVAVAGDHHDRQVGMVLLDLLQQLQAVELGALQPDVEEHQMRAAVGDLGQRGIAVARGPRRKPFVVQDARDEVANIGFVVDNQNVTRHGSRPPVSCLLRLRFLFHC